MFAHLHSLQVPGMTDLNIDETLPEELQDPMAGTGISFAVSALHHRSAETPFHMPPPLITDASLYSISARHREIGVPGGRSYTKLRLT